MSQEPGNHFDDSSTAQNLFQDDHSSENQDDSYNSQNQYNIQQEKYFDCYKIVDLPVIEVKTQYEQEQVIHEFKCLLYRWKDEQWKQRSNHIMKFIKHKKTAKIRAFMTSYKTYFTRASFYLEKVDNLCQLSKSQTIENTWTWKAKDYSQGQPKIELFAAQFKTKEQFETFGGYFNEGCSNNKSISSKIENQQSKENQKCNKDNNNHQENLFN